MLQTGLSCLQFIYVCQQVVLPISGHPQTPCCIDPFPWLSKMLDWSESWEISHGFSEEYSVALGDTDSSSAVSPQVRCENSPDKEQQWIVGRGNESRIIVYRYSSMWLQGFGMLLTQRLGRTGQTSTL
jgi:hypothetical protein